MTATPPAHELAPTRSERLDRLPFTRRHGKLLGASGIDAMTRIMGFLLICMGAQFCINGVKEVAQDPVFHGAPTAAHAGQLRELPKLESLESELAPKAP